MESNMELENALAHPIDSKVTDQLDDESLHWPENVVLYQPPEEEQLLLPERASCLAVRTYLRMCRLPYLERQCENAEFMTPGGRLTRLPLLRIGQRLFTEFEPIASHVEANQLSHALSGWLDSEEREDMRTVVTYADNTFTLTELHQCYLDPPTYAGHTQPRNGEPHPWPLSSMRRHDKRQEALRLLRVYQWQQLDTRGAQLDLQQCCQLLSDRLKIDRPTDNYLCGARLCELDALVFGHVTAMLTSDPLSPMMAQTVRSYPRLVAHSRRIDEQFHQGKLLGGPH